MKNYIVTHRYIDTNTSKYYSMESAAIFSNIIVESG